jgi:DNA-binding transcriptional regulator YdaS (Cro superfamily)
VTSTPTKLKQILDHEGRRQSWLAEQIGVGRSVVCQWCSGHKQVPKDRRPQIARVLGRNEAEIF